GDLVPVRLGPFRAHMAFGPREIEELLLARAADVRKSVGTRMLIPLVGHGLLTAEGEEWLGRRRLVAPAFHRQQVAGYADTMLRYADDAAGGWRGGQRIDVHAELTALTLRIAARVLFDADVTPQIAQISRIGTEIQDFYFDRYASVRFLLPTWVPTPGNRRLRRGIRRLDAIVYGIIRERDPEDDRGDVLSLLVRARDERGQALTQQQIRDEVMTLLLAGHETTALALTWAFVLLDRNPEARDRLEAELASVLGTRPATLADVPSLPYTNAVANETLRLYPPAYATGREALRDIDIGGTRIRKRHVVFASMYATHRDPRFFPEPDRFRPERWLDGLEKRLPRGAFVPFGLGPRKCIGSSFAMLELALVLATIARRWRFAITAPEIPLKPGVTLRPAIPVDAVAHRVVADASTMPQPVAAATAAPDQAAATPSS
ncbi:MAG: cytochrome P450, partial [Chloroflexota bacterium]